MLDIHTLMRGLAEKRPVFHSEADFQFALASHIREDCDQPVRLEWKPFPGEPSVAAPNEYSRLGEHLANRSRKPWPATFSELEDILREPLPDEAKGERNWWANCYGAPQATAWMEVGWRVSKVDLSTKTVCFLRSQMYVDLWLPGLGVAIELKYATRELECRARASDLRPPCEAYSLRSQAAQDITRYDFVKDVARLERVVDGCPDARRGIAVLLTNNPLYWECSKKKNGKPIDEDFHLHQGRKLRQAPDGMDWTEGAKEGTKKGKDVPIVLNGSYPALAWKCYSDLDGDRQARNRTLCYLAVEVPPVATAAAGGESPKRRAGCSLSS